MDLTNRLEIITRPSVVECTTHLTDGGSTRKLEPEEAVLQAGEVQNKITTSNLEKSGGENSKHLAKEGKLSQKRKMTTKENLPLKRKMATSENLPIKRKMATSENLPLKRKMATSENPPVKRKKAASVPTSQMVMESIKTLRKRNGASVEAILEHMEGQYKVNPKFVKRYVSRFLQSAVQKGIVEQLSGVGNDGKFKIKKAEKIIKVEKKLNANEKMVKVGKDAKIYQKLNADQKKIGSKKVAKIDKNQNQKIAKRGKAAKAE